MLYLVVDAPKWKKKRKRDPKREREKKANVRQRNENAMKGVCCLFCSVWLGLLGDSLLVQMQSSEKNQMKKNNDSEGEMEERTNEKNHTEKTHKQLQIYMFLFLYVYTCVTKNYLSFIFFVAFCLIFFMFLLHFHLPFEKRMHLNI